MNLSQIRQLLKFLRKKKPLLLEEVGVVFLGPRKMASINSAFLAHRGPTDVITFCHGEILVCPQIAAAQTTRLGKKYMLELLLYIIHGWLHLGGMEDSHPISARKMATEQTALLQKFLRYSQRKRTIL